MERVVATYEIDSHEVSVVEVMDDEGSWFHVVIEGLSGEEMLPAPPSAEEVHAMVARRLAR